MFHPLLRFVFVIVLLWTALYAATMMIAGHPPHTVPVAGNDAHRGGAR